MACEICKKPYIPASNDPDYESDTKPHVCNICGKSFSLKIQLKRHILTHAGGAPYICHTCDISGKSALKLYNLRMSKNSNTCDICHKTFSTKRLLERHFKEHVGTLETSEMREVENDVTDENLEEQSSAYKSKKTHLKRRMKNLNFESVKEDINTNFKCEFCGKVFAYKQNCEKHKLSHKKKDLNLSVSEELNVSVDNDKKHTCEICGKTFTRKSSLEGHMMTHQVDDGFDSTGGDEFEDYDSSAESDFDVKQLEIPKLKLKTSVTFICDICKKLCASQRGLNRHMRVHKELIKKPDSDSKESNVQDETMSVDHSDLTTEISPDSSLNSKSVIEETCTGERDHSNKDRKRKKEKTYTCETCNEVFFKKSRLRKHRFSHLSREDSSDKIESSGMEKKIRIKKFSCEFCGKRFAGETCLKKHVSKHNGEDGNNITVEKKHKGLKTYTCEFCNQEFTVKKHAFQKHLHSHTPEVCGICDERFVDRQSLREHCRVHVGTEEGRIFMECSQKALDAKNGVLPPEPKIEYIYLVIR